MSPSTSLEIILNVFNPSITKAGFESTEKGLEEIKREILGYHRRGFRHEKDKVKTPKGVLFSLDKGGNLLKPPNLSDMGLVIFNEASRYNQLYLFYCKIINFEAETDYLDNFY